MMPPIRQVPTTLPAPLQAELRRIGAVIDPVATGALFTPQHRAKLAAGITCRRDQAYGPDPRHRLDVFTPDPAAPQARPILVFVHGGGFVGGNKHTPGTPYYDNLAQWAVRLGWVGINLTYRLAPQHPWPAAQQDIADALAWVHHHATNFGGDTSRLCLVGHSAGAAHVAQYLARPEFHPLPHGGVERAILMSGLYDPASSEPNERLQAYFGQDKQRYAEYATLTGLAQWQHPLLALHAELDPAEFHQQAHLLANGLQALEHPAFQAVELLGHSHLSEVYGVGTGDNALESTLENFLMLK